MKQLLTAVIVGLFLMAPVSASAMEECDDLASAANDMENFKTWLDEADEVELDAKSVKEMRRGARTLSKLGELIAEDDDSSRSERVLGRDLARSSKALERALGGKRLAKVVNAYEGVVDSLDDLTDACDDAAAEDDAVLFD